MKLSSHLALITGAGQGIGRACAEVFAARGAALILLDKNPETLSQVAENLAESGSDVISRVVDLTETERLHEVMEEVMDARPIDILVNNAGFDRPGTSARITREAFLEVIEIHVMVPLTLIQLLLPGMRTAGWGRIINISSIYGITGAKGELAYCTAKAGIIGLTKSVAKEAAADGVTVNAIVPGLIRTPTIENFMAEKYKLLVINDTPAGRIGEAEEVARLVAFLASEDASYVTGSAVPVSGGWGI